LYPLLYFTHNTHTERYTMTFIKTNTTMWTSPNQSLGLNNIAPQPTPTNNLGGAFKPKKAGKDKSHVIFVLDDSSSMQSCRKQTIEGFNEFLEGQKVDATETDIETFVSLYKFDGSNVNCVIDQTDVQSVEPLNEKTYNPRGSTNLLDAMGGVMMKTNLQLSEKKKKNRESVIVVILTDGEENCSRTFANNDIKQMVEKAEGKNWGFMFLGANIDAFSVGASMGFSQHNTMQYSTKNMGETMRSASAMSSRMKSAYASGMDTTIAYASSTFTEEERLSAVNDDSND